MKITTIAAVLLSLVALPTLSCSAGGSESDAGNVAGPARSEASPAKVSELRSETEAEVEKRTAFDEKLAARGEAFAQEVPAELARELEAQYQASLHRASDGIAPLSEGGNEPSVDFAELFDRIRNTMPPARAALLAQYASAATRISDVAKRTALLDRLASPELNNVH